MNSDATVTLKLPPVLDLAGAEAFLEMIRRCFDSGRRVCLDASDVEALTLPCIQIILAALRSNGFASIASPSTAFVNAFADLALDWRVSRETEDQQVEDQDSEQAPAQDDE